MHYFFTVVMMNAGQHAHNPCNAEEILIDTRCTINQPSACSVLRSVFDLYIKRRSNYQFCINNPADYISTPNSSKRFAMAKFSASCLMAAFVLVALMVRSDIKFSYFLLCYYQTSKRLISFKYNNPILCSLFPSKLRLPPVKMTRENCFGFQDAAFADPNNGAARRDKKRL